VRQASLPSQLRDAPAMDAQARAAGPGPGLNADRSPEQARNVVASFRAAYQRELGDDAPQAADAEHTQTQNPQAQQTQVPGAQGSGEQQTATPQQEEM
jgi:hypothetical protein